SYTIVALLGYQMEKTNRASLVSSYGKSSITWLGLGTPCNAIAKAQNQAQEKNRCQRFFGKSDADVTESLTSIRHDNK
ncbi:hypothetical protein ACFL6S_33125, partial [Candidatus Poribacteria bacterium]